MLRKLKRFSPQSVEILHFSTIFTVMEATRAKAWAGFPVETNRG
ncbi:MAG: hypothetical protein V2B20_14905 [Pseudomonadota bacterium]